jgi:cell division protein FtsQ
LETKKINYLNLWINLRLLLIIGLVGFLMAFTGNRNQSRKLRKSVVEFIGEDNQFVARKTVNKLLICNADSVSSLQKLNLDLNQLEKTIKNHNMIEQSEVFVTIDGVLKTIVKQKTPIARFFNNTGSFYIDYQGNKMPLSSLHSARVPLVFGSINAKNKKDLFQLFKTIYDDDFLKKNIIEIQIMSNNDVFLKNRNYDFDIDFGKCAGIEEKFKNYQAFFLKSVQDSTINNYKKITLRFTHQVVGTKKD